MKVFLILASLAIFSLIACTDDGSVTQVKKEVAVLDSPLHALEKTRLVDSVLQQSADERQKALDVE